MENKSQYTSFGWSWISIYLFSRKSIIIPPKCRFRSSKFQASVGASRNKFKNPNPIKSVNLEKQNRNLCCQQFEQFLTIYLRDPTYF